ncbi:uncharacterized protein [Spinacia oleracea]|uniref:Uncharacterized protein isoform X2 n=1 Tax=Spinacia oleracea TaxID=3562 RepID=A0ABM3R9T6_SPIOL|nr:uncharacterized protein LOC110803464 isoform X2 [Spinacia oleracea]
MGIKLSESEKPLAELYKPAKKMIDETQGRLKNLESDIENGGVHDCGGSLLSIYYEISKIRSVCRQMHASLLYSTPNYRLWELKNLIDEQSLEMKFRVEELVASNEGLCSSKTKYALRALDDSETDLHKLINFLGFCKRSMIQLFEMEDTKGEAPFCDKRPFWFWFWFMIGSIVILWLFLLISSISSLSQQR